MTDYTAWLVPDRSNTALQVIVPEDPADDRTSLVTVEVERIPFSDVLGLRNDQDWPPAWERWTWNATLLLAEQGWDVAGWSHAWPEAVALATVTRRASTDEED